MKSYASKYKMKKTAPISEEIKATLSAFETIKPTAVSTDFKKRVLSNMYRKENDSKGLKWFTPSFQWAAIALIVLVNAYSIQYLLTTERTTTIKTFAESYYLTSSSTTILD